MRLHSSQRKGTGPSCLAQREDEPRGSPGSRDIPLLSKRRRSRRSWSQRIAGGAEAEAKESLELDRSVGLSGSSSAGSSSDSSASAQQSYPAVAARTTKGTSSHGDDERPSTSAHFPKRMRASVRKSVLNSELAAALDRTQRCPTAMRFTCCQLQH
ncbi:hypothetical protein GWK47_054618 [Chionoecetes opilio]|uniref:Uncharacterized protein n=1 Tax=Chionoecetes opilio TaxID=41210 RepID=A0A8J5C7A1_CHIOP|nr:hypothetical protein GWK47_054618 [Chionoecetes opilio]